MTLDLLRAQYPTFSSKSFSDRIPPINLRLPGVDQIHRKGRRAPAEVEVIRFTQPCQIMFSRSPTGPCVPPIESSHSISKTAPCSVCPSFPLWVLKCGGCKVITAPNCTNFQPLGLGKVAGDSRPRTGFSPAMFDYRRVISSKVSYERHVSRSSFIKNVIVQVAKLMTIFPN